MKLIFICLITFFTQSFDAIAQSKSNPIIAWEKTGTHQQALKDAVLLPDGRIAIAGIDYSMDKSTGLFMVIDAKSGKILQKKRFPALLKNSGFNGLVEADDGSFYVVGYTQSTKKSQKAWLLRLDEKGEKIWEKELGDAGKSELTHITWLSDGTGLAAGYKEKLNNGNIWLLSIKDGQIQGEQTIGTGVFQDLIGLEKTIDGQAWLCGNTKKSKEHRSPDIWLVQTNQKLTTNDNYQIIGGEKRQYVTSMSINYKGDLLIGGSTNKGTVGNQTAWLTTLTTSGKVITEFDDGGIEENSITAVLKTADGENWLSRETVEDNAQPDLKSTQYGYLSAKKAINLQPLKINQVESFRVKKIIQSYQGHKIFLGNDLATNTFKIIALQAPPKLVAKSLTKINYENLKFYFEDNNKDGCFSEEERGWIRFILKNEGTAAIHEGTINLQQQNIVEGISFPRTFQYFSYLAKQSARIITFPVVGTPEMEAGKSVVQLKITIQDRPSLTIPIDIESIHCPNKMGNPIELYWEPGKINPDTKTIRSVEEEIMLGLNIEAPRILKLGDVKIYKNGVLIEDEKNQQGQISYSNNEKANYLHLFKYKLRHLKQGKNEIYMEVEGYKSAPITVVHEPRKPNLHILAIGPTYTDLKYPAKDARDFVKALKKHYNRDFFNELHIDTLTSEANTNAYTIKNTFEELTNRYTNSNHEKHIVDKDYLMIFISGHGENHNGRFALIPSDYKETSRVTSSVDYETDVLRFLNQINCKKILFIDACLSGIAVGEKAGTSPQISKALLIANNSAAGTAAFTSCSENESSFEYHKGQNGIFTEVLIEAISQQSVQLSNGQFLQLDVGFKNKLKEVGDGIITLGELYQFLVKRVPDLLQSVRSDYDQNPDVALNSLEENLPIFVLKKNKK